MPPYRDRILCNTSLTKKAIIYLMHYPIWYVEMTIIYTTITQIQNKYNQNKLQALQKNL